jgi:hypothetical protein
MPTSTLRRPRHQIEHVVLEVAQDHQLPVDALTVFAANRHHGPTSSGARSDHQGPGEYAWAADLPARSLLEGDRIAADVAHILRLDWPGQGIHSEVRWGRRYQLIWRAEGHFDHVHIGVRRTDRQAPPPRFH